MWKEGEGRVGHQLGQILLRREENHHWLGNVEAINDAEKAVWVERLRPEA